MFRRSLLGKQVLANTLSRVERRTRDTVLYCMLPQIDIKDVLRYKVLQLAVRVGKTCGAPGSLRRLLRLPVGIEPPVEGFALLGHLP